MSNQNDIENDFDRIAELEQNSLFWKYSLVWNQKV